MKQTSEKIDVGQTTINLKHMASNVGFRKLEISLVEILNQSSQG